MAVVGLGKKLVEALLVSILVIPVILPLIVGLVKIGLLENTIDPVPVVPVDVVPPKVIFPLNVGLLSVGLVPNTKAPVPVGSLMMVLNCELVVVPNCPNPEPATASVPPVGSVRLLLPDKFNVRLYPPLVTRLPVNVNL